MMTLESVGPGNNSRLLRPRLSYFSEQCALQSRPRNGGSVSVLAHRVTVVQCKP